MLFEPFGGQIFFETKSPELTTFYGQRVTSTIWDAFPDINRMNINRSEIYHQNNPPISNYEPSLLGTSGQPLQFKYLYNNSLISPILAGPGIAVDYVPVDSYNNGYIKISNTFANAVTSGPGSSNTAPIYNPTSQTFKVFEVGPNLSRHISESYKYARELYKFH